MQQPGHRSLFVTVIAWCTIVSAAFGVVIGLAQNVFFALFMSPEQLARMLAMLPPGMEAVAEVTYGSLRVALLAFLALAVIFLLTGIGLLRRRNWARVVFVAAIATGTLYSVVTYFLLDTAGDLAVLVPTATIDGTTADFAPMVAMMRATATALTIVLTAFNLWLIWRLLSPAIRREFD
jgi:uncharacterized membrane protein YozB (DUF420 family)